MVAARTALPRAATFTGLRPMDVTRDLAGVADVLAESFRGEMDAAGERAVREMRMIGRLGPFAWWFDLFMPVSEGFSPGFVWVEQGRVVGNAAIRRAPAPGWGHVIGNVAVLPEYRGRGVARHLMEACLDKARGDNSQWVALEVRDDNAPAHHLYTRLGFKQTGAMAQLRREAIGPIVDKAELPFGVRVRKPHASEQGQVFALAHSATPEGLRWAEPLRESEFVFDWERRFDLWMAGRRESWRVVESNGRLVGAVEAETYHNPSEEGRLRMWVTGSSDCHNILLDAALSAREAASRPMLIAHPATDVDASQVLERYGFRPVRTLAHMKLNLR